MISVHAAKLILHFVTKNTKFKFLRTTLPLKMSLECVIITCASVLLSVYEVANDDECSQCYALRIV